MKKSIGILLGILFSGLLVPLLGQTIIISNTTSTICSGAIYDSGGPTGDYSSSESFVHTLTPSTAGTKVQLNFTDFDLGSGDALSIYNNNSGSGPVITYSGTTSPGTITSSAPDGSLTLRFTSGSGSSNGPGFAAAISCIDPPSLGDYVIISGESATICSGTLYDPGYTNDYFNSDNTTYTLFPATPGTKIQVDFTSFNLASGDALTIYDRNVASGPFISYSGTSSPGTVTSSAADGSLTFRFQAGSGSSNGPGFEATISCIDPPSLGDYVIISGESATTCSGTLYDPGYTNDYFNSDNTTYTLFPATPGTKIQVDFTSFNLASGDALTIYDRNVASGPFISYSGTSSPGTVTSSAADGSLTFRFQAGSGSSNGPGFEATISCIDPPSLGDYVIISGESATTCSGTLYDPGYTNDYFNSDNTTYTLFPATPGTKIQVDFTSFNLASGDALTIYDRNVASGPFISYSGTSSPGTVTSSAADGSLTFRFQAGSGSSNGPGFEATISCIDPPSLGDYVIISGESATTCSGTLYDPGYTNDYFNSDNTTYTLFPATPGTKIQVDFTSFNLASGDALTIYDRNVASGPFISYSGTSSPGTVTSSAADGSLTFRFQAGSGSSNGPGFEATISCIDPPSLGDYVIIGGESATTCSGTLYDPGYTNDYFNSDNTTYTLFPASPGDRISLDFSSFSLGSGDQLIIYDGNSVSSPLIGTFSGSTLPPTITSSSCDGSLTFRFLAGSGSSNGPGFEAGISCTSGGPGGFSGTITNIGFDLDLTVTGGAAPYTYSWTGPSGFSSSAEDISAPEAGTYTVEINSPSEPCPAFASFELLAAIPTMGEWGLIILGLCLLNLGAIAVWKRKIRIVCEIE